MVKNENLPQILPQNQGKTRAKRKNNQIFIQKCKEKHPFMQFFLHKWVILVDDQGLEAVREGAESLIIKGIQGLVFQIVCQKI